MLTEGGDCSATYVLNNNRKAHYYPCVICMLFF